MHAYMVERPWLQAVLCKQYTLHYSVQMIRHMNCHLQVVIMMMMMMLLGLMSFDWMARSVFLQYHRSLLQIVSMDYKKCTVVLNTPVIKGEGFEGKKSQLAKECPSIGLCFQHKSLAPSSHLWLSEDFVMRKERFSLECPIIVAEYSFWYLCFSHVVLQKRGSHGVAKNDKIRDRCSKDWKTVHSHLKLLC